MNPFAALRAFWVGLLLLCCSLPLRAEQFGLFTYEVVNGSTVTITGYPTNATGPVEIPAEIAGRPVTSIGGHAFSGCSGLTNVIIPSSVTSTGFEAFLYCTGLTGVTIPSSVTSIGGWAFYGCTGLTSVILQQGITTLGRGMFAGCTGLISVTIPSSVTSIRLEAFSGCTGLSSVAISSSVTSIEHSVFLGCTGLTSVTLPSSITSIGPAAFYGCTGLTSVSIPSSVTSIGDSAFFGCAGLISVTLPSSVTSIGNNVFSGCTGLTSVTIPSRVTTIGDSAFSGCTGLTSVSIPSSVTSIRYSAFSGCSGLISVTLPSSVTSIGWGAFSGCTGLTSVTIPSRVTTIGDSAFSGCTELTSVNVEPGNPFYVSDGGVLLNAARTLLVLYPGGKAGSYSIPSGVTRIGDSAFSGCIGLTSLAIPSSVTSIGSVYEGPEEPFSIPAFTGCSAMTRMVFLGNAPVTVSGEFLNAAPGFTIYYLSSRSGFTSPTWLGYPSTMINETTYPAAAWLMEHGLWYDTDLHTDPDGDGVDLLMAYALDLNPRQDLRASLPVPVLSENTLSLSFHATAPGVTYRAETSTGLTNWTTTGVTQSAPDPDGRSTATILLDVTHRFLRLSVED